MKCQVCLLLVAVVLAVRSSPVGRAETLEGSLPNIIPLDQTSPHIPEEAVPEETPRDLSSPKDSQESDEDDSWSMLIPKGRTGTVNFFPISFGGAARSGSLGGATAIANSFSTGRKGAATSHATAYGDPSLRNWEGRN